MPAKEVIALFELDHVRFHTWAEDETVNEWWNLTYLEKHVHREKTRIDQGKIAKVRRRAKREALEKAQAKVQEVLLGKRWDKKPDNKPKWKRKINGKTVRVDANGKEL